jgi:quercetin dioxygenase-like cupin family protein
MPYPAFIDAFPALDLPFPDDVVRSRAIRSEAGLVVFFEFLTDVELPAHSHKAQWGVLLEGEIELTIAGTTRSYAPGEAWDIPEGVAHSVRVKAGARAIDVFEEPDRYPLRGP